MNILIFDTQDNLYQFNTPYITWANDFVMNTELIKSYGQKLQNYLERSIEQIEKFKNPFALNYPQNVSAL